MRSPKLLAIALLLTAVVMLFGRTVTFDFVGWDDDINLYDNALLEPVRGESLRAFWRAPYEKLYVPLTYTAWAGLVGALQKLDPAATDLRNHAWLFHLGNVLLHAANAALVFSILLAMLGWCGGADDPPRRSTIAAAALGAASFALHPLQVEPVAWATGLKDLLGGFWQLAGLRVAIAAIDASDARRSLALWLAASLCLVAGLLSKPSAATLPVIVLAAALLRGGRTWRRCLVPLGLWSLAAAVVLIATKLSQPAPATASGPLWHRPLIAADALVFYLGKLVSPIDLCVIYGRTPAAVSDGAAFFWTPLIVAAVIVTACLAPHRRVWTAALLIFAGSLAPVLGFVPFQHQVFSTVADRYAYVAMLGPALASAHASSRSPIARAAVIAAVLAWAGIAAIQLDHWRTTERLFTRVLAVDPGSATAHNNLGNFYERTGDGDRARRHYLASLEREPQHGLALNNLGNLHYRAGEIDTARDWYQRALVSPTPKDRIDAANNLAVIAMEQGRLDEAADRLGALLEENPTYTNALNNLGLVEIRRGRPFEAIEPLRGALRQRPTYETARHNLAEALNDAGYARMLRGELDDAEPLLAEAIALRPELLVAHVNLGTLYLDRGDPNTAAGVWLRALEVLPERPELLHNLAIVSLRQADRRAARAFLERALAADGSFEPSLALLASPELSHGD